MSDAIDHLKDIPTVAVDTLEGHAYFTGKTIIADDGTKRDTIETALLNSGFCVSVDLPIDASEMQDAPGVSETEILLPVHVQVNPEVNGAQATPVSILEAVENVFAALLGYSNGANRFTALPSKPFELIVSDKGLTAYVCWLKKQIVLS
jgi:hypothetical protein